MQKERPYQVVTYSSDIGSDEKMDYDCFVDAVKAAQRFRKEEEYAAVYVRSQRKAYVVFGDVYAPVFADWVSVAKLEYA